MWPKKDFTYGLFDSICVFRFVESGCSVATGALCDRWSIKPTGSSFCGVFTIALYSQKALDE